MHHSIYRDDSSSIDWLLVQQLAVYYGMYVADISEQTNDCLLDRIVVEIWRAVGTVAVPIVIPLT